MMQIQEAACINRLHITNFKILTGNEFCIFKYSSKIICSLQKVVV